MSLLLKIMFFLHISIKVKIIDGNVLTLVYYFHSNILILSIVILTIIKRYRFYMKWWYLSFSAFFITNEHLILYILFVNKYTEILH